MGEKMCRVIYLGRSRSRTKIKRLRNADHNRKEILKLPNLTLISPAAQVALLHTLKNKTRLVYIKIYAF